MHIVYPAVVSALLFSIGIYGVMARRNTILVLMSVELMLNAVNLNLIAFDVWLKDALHGGQVLTLFVIVIAAAELGLGLAIVLAVFRNRQTIDIDNLRTLSEPPSADLISADPTPAAAGATTLPTPDQGSSTPLAQVLSAGATQLLLADNPRKQRTDPALADFKNSESNPSISPGGLGEMPENPTTEDPGPSGPSTRGSAR